VVGFRFAKTEFFKESRYVPGFMTKQNKLVVLYALEKRGVFLMKGAVREVSARLGVAAPTIYTNT
jgi:predicted transcriptional regulator YheO